MTDITDNDANREAVGASADEVENAAPRVPHVSVEIPVLVYATGEQGEPFYDNCKTITVNPQGALLSVARTVAVGQSVLLINPKSGKEMICNVKSASTDESGVNHVEIEFSKKSPKFWRITFPAQSSDPSVREAPQTPAPEGDPSVQPIPRTLAEPSLDRVPESGTGTSSEPAEIGQDQEENIELLTQPDTEPLPDLEPGGASEPKTTQAEETKESAGNGEIRETTGVSAPATRRSGRRVPRLRLKMPVLVSLPGEPAHEECETVEVATLGALLVVSRPVHMDQELLLTNPKSLKQITCHVRSMREVASGVVHVGVEFATESDKFWGMTFPSEDWDPAERKTVQRPLQTVQTGKPPVRRQPGQSLPGMRKTAGATNTEPIGFPIESEGISKRGVKNWPVLRWPILVLAGVTGLILLFVAISHRSTNEPAPATSSAVDTIAPEDAEMIPGLESSRLATVEDFDPDAVSWLRGSGQQVSGKIPGVYSNVDISSAYILITKENARRVVILADGQLRCDAEYPVIAVAARIPKALIDKITWADPSPPESDGDGLLIVRAADAPASGVVLFLRGTRVVSANPVDYRQIPLGQLP